MSDSRPLSIIRSAKMLRGNARTMMPFEPLFSISWALLQFYMGLYLQAQGLTARQMGYLIAIRAVSAILFSFFGGYLTNKFGRKRTLLVTDIIAYPGFVLICFFADRFELFVLAYFVQGLNVVVNVAWTCFMVEDINTEERIASYNFINGLGLSAGILTPISGFVVGKMGLVPGQRAILGVAFFVLILRILLRNHFGKETEIGKRIMAERKNSHTKLSLFSGANLVAVKGIIRSPKLLFAVCASALWQMYVSTAAMNTGSIYYVSFLTNVLGINEQMVSVIGSLTSVLMLFSFLFITPRAICKPLRRGLIRNAIMLILAVSGVIAFGGLSIIYVFLFIALYALSYQGIQPLLSTMTTDAATGCDMPSVLSILAMLTSIVTAVSGYISGAIYERNPYVLYGISIVVLALLCVAAWNATAKAKPVGETAPNRSV